MLKKKAVTKLFKSYKGFVKDHENFMKFFADIIVVINSSKKSSKSIL